MLCCIMWCISVTLPAKAHRQFQLCSGYETRYFVRIRGKPVLTVSIMFYENPTLCCSAVSGLQGRRQKLLNADCFVLATSCCYNGYIKLLRWGEREPSKEGNTCNMLETLFTLPSSVLRFVRGLLLRASRCSLKNVLARWNYCCQGEIKSPYYDNTFLQRLLFHHKMKIRQILYYLLVSLRVILLVSTCPISVHLRRMPSEIWENAGQEALFLMSSQALSVSSNAVHKVYLIEKIPSRKAYCNPNTYTPRHIQ